MTKIIISAAITGSIHVPSQSPHLPYRPEDIAAQAIEAGAAGAAILHLHARRPDDGHPSSDPDHWRAFLPEVAAQSPSIINMTTGGSAIMTLDQRLAAPREFAPEMASLNMGSMNFALYPMIDRIKTWKFPWEEAFLRNSDDVVFKNTPRDIAFVLSEMGEKRGARFEFECYDLSHLVMLRHFADRGLVKPPFFIQFVFGVLGGMPAEAEVLTSMKRHADRLFGGDYLFSVLGAGRMQMPLATMAAGMGGHVRVGLEDNLYLDKGRLAKSSAEQVRRIREIVEALGRVVATPDETRAMLHLKGREAVAI